MTNGVRTMKPTWTERLDAGLDPMWDFLRFHPEKPTVKDVEVLENYLDDLRTLMAQKSAWQPGRESKTSGYVAFEDLEMTINSIVIQTMWIYLSGGLKMLKEVMKSE